MAEMDLKKLSRGELIVAASGILLLIFSFFDWFSLKVGGVKVAGANAWDVTLAWFAVVIGIVMAAQVIAEKLGGMSLKLGSIGWGQVHLVLGAVAFLLVLIKLIAGVDVVTSFLGRATGYSSGRSIGVFLGLVASAGLAFRGCEIAKERGELPGFLKGVFGGSKS